VFCVGFISERRPSPYNPQYAEIGGALIELVSEESYER